MLNQKEALETLNNFNLKNVAVELVPSLSGTRTLMTIEALEAMRTQRRSVPASKHGLETICGASCETGAQ
jgi:hypothetical protein